jgi:DNA repair exonuclease SbcCD ATPase subunit
LKIKETKDRIREEEIKIESIKTSNERIRKSIMELENRSRIWQKNLSETLKNLEKEISLMENLNIEEEIRIHEEKQKYLKNRELLEKTKSNLNHVEKNILENEKRLKKSENYRNRICEEKCPMCGQKLHNKDTLLENLDREIFELKKNLEENYSKKRKYEKEIEQLFMDENILNEKTFYKEISDAYNHRIILQKLKESMKEKMNQKNPYEEQIKSLEETGIQEIDFTTLNNLTYRKNHQELLLKLLMNKDSFIRKKIMDQSLNYLNSRLKYYTESLQLPHQVKFLNDLSVEINELGVDFDFDNLSRGEKTRLILALSWAFRDVYESMNDNINIMFIDELIDNGLDQLGVESAVLQLKKISTENRKNIFLISHREDLTNQVENILYVIKENGFTNILTEET